MNDGSICTRELVTITPHIDVATAAQCMREKNVGFLVAVDPQPNTRYGRPVGVLTDRDIVVSVVAGEADPKMLTVADVMKQYPAMVDETDPLDQALRTMRRMGVRRLPVVGAGGMLTGVLSLDDVLDVLAGELREVSGTVRGTRHRADRAQ
jgi:CBS domain-containing protein